mgnify:CR=1 FL=1
MDKTWYEVAVSSPTHGSKTIESFDSIVDAKKFATALSSAYSKDMLSETEKWLLANDIESVFINRWTWDGENNNELDETFKEVRYEIQKSTMWNGQCELCGSSKLSFLTVSVWSVENQAFKHDIDPRTGLVATPTEDWDIFCHGCGEDQVGVYWVLVEENKQ